MPCALQYPATTSSELGLIHQSDVCVCVWVSPLSGLETLLKAGHDCGCFAASTQSAANSLSNIFFSSSFLLNRCVHLNPGADKFEVRKFSKLFAALSETSYGPYTLMSPTKAMETNNQIPLVVLFGWSGARDAHLRSYAKAYASKGYRTLRGTSHQWYVVVPHGFSLGERSLPILCRDFLLNPSRLRSFALEAFAVANVCALLCDLASLEMPSLLPIFAGDNPTQ